MDNKFKINELLIKLDDRMYEYVQKSFSIKKFWYWDYYDSIKEDIRGAKERRKIYKQIYHLERFGNFTKDGFSVRGFRKLLKIKSTKLKESKKWDKKWRVVIFDIPEKMRSRRNCFRDSLKCIGFKMLQASMWISPFGDFDDIQNLAKYYKVEKYVVLIIADKISNDLLFKKKFKL